MADSAQAKAGAGSTNETWKSSTRYQRQPCRVLVLAATGPVIVTRTTLEIACRCPILGW